MKEVHIILSIPFSRCQWIVTSVQEKLLRGKIWKDAMEQARPGKDASGLCLSLICKSMKRRMNRLMKRVKEALKTRLLTITFSIGFHRGQNQPRNTIFAQALRNDGLTDGRTDGRTDRPSYRDARTHLKMEKEIKLLPVAFLAN